MKTSVPSCFCGKTNPIRKIFVTVFFCISTFLFSQTAERKILFKGDSIWYAAQNDFLFSSINKGEKWDTIFANDKPNEGFFLNGSLDTTKNLFISDSRTIFVFGWDGTLHYKTILYCTSDGGKSWNRNDFNSNDGTVGVKYFHKISSNQFFLDLRGGDYATTIDGGKKWHCDNLIYDKYGGKDEQFTFEKNGDISYAYFPDKYCKRKTIMISHDGGLTWKKSPQE